MSGRYEERIRRVLVGLPPTGIYSAAFSASLILYAYLQQGSHCDDHAPPADGTGGSGHRVMLVAGIGSKTGDDGRTTAIPAERLGYAPDEISAFSYAADGGPYTKGDTYAPLLTSARRLADQLRAQQRSDPGREVDLIAHSQGGVVVLAFLKLVYDPADATYPPLGKVITLSSPLQGAPLATLADEIRDFPGAGPQGLNLIDAAPGPIPDLDTRAVEDLAEDSPFMAELDAARLPESVELTTIGSLFDYVVPADRATVGGAQHTIIDAGLRDPHTNVQTDDEALMAMRSALEGRPLPCQSLARCRTRVAHPARDHARRDAAGRLPAHEWLRGATMSARRTRSLALALALLARVLGRDALVDGVPDARAPIARPRTGR